MTTVDKRWVIVGPDNCEFDGLTCKGEPIWNVDGGITFMTFYNANIRLKMLHSMGWRCAVIRSTILHSIGAVED